MKDFQDAFTKLSQDICKSKTKMSRCSWILGSEKTRPQGCTSNPWAGLEVLVPVVGPSLGVREGGKYNYIKWKIKRKRQCGRNAVGKEAERELAYVRGHEEVLKVLEPLPTFVRITRKFYSKIDFSKTHIRFSFHSNDILIWWRTHTLTHTYTKNWCLTLRYLRSAQCCFSGLGECV